MKIKIGSTIKSLRKQKQISQKQLAEAIGVTAAAVSKWEKETCYPDLEHLPPLADFFSVTTDRLLNIARE